jgi:thiamine transport system substrate-binding protein
VNRSFRRALGTAVIGTLAASTLAACGSGGGGKSDESSDKTGTLVTHGSFAASEDVLKEFTERTGYKVKVLAGGDAGSAVNQAVLNAGNPQGDVFFGVDNTLLSRALKAGIFTPYTAKDLDKIPERYQLDKDKPRVTPVDTGQICVNYDRAYFEKKHLKPPQTFDDLVKPQYKNLLVTENAATSSPGLGFLLASIQSQGKDWQQYWKKLKANGVKVDDGWEQAYNDDFSGSAAGRGKGDRPLVVSYASSPPAEVLGKKPLPDQAPTGVAEGTCFEQTEFAGLLKGAKNPEGGKALLDFLISKTFQQDVPLQMFVSPVREGADVPEVFSRYGADVEDPLTMAPQKIDKNREQWVKSWTSLVLR